MCSVLRGTGPTTPGAQRRGIEIRFGLLGYGIRDREVRCSSVIFVYLDFFSEG